MSYNPALLKNKSSRRRAKKHAPTGGLKHSEIMRRKGVGFDATSSEKEKTVHGYTSPVFSCSTFTQRFVGLYAGNNTGLGVNKKADRTVRVMTGTLFVTIQHTEKVVDDDGKTEVKNVSEIQKYNEGHTVNFPKGMVYSLASSGSTNTELLITETHDYNSTWTEISEASVNVPDGVMFVPPKTAMPRRKRGESKAHQQAAKASGKRSEAPALAETRQRQASDTASSVVGVNPRPMGPPKE